jgi:hypothetical protein
MIPELSCRRQVVSIHLKVPGDQTRSVEKVDLEQLGREHPNVLVFFPGNDVYARKQLSSLTERLAQKFPDTVIVVAQVDPRTGQSPENKDAERILGVTQANSRGGRVLLPTALDDAERLAGQLSIDRNTKLPSSVKWMSHSSGILGPQGLFQSFPNLKDSTRVIALGPTVANPTNAYSIIQDGDMVVQKRMGWGLNTQGREISVVDLPRAKDPALVVRGSEQFEDPKKGTTIDHTEHGLLSYLYGLGPSSAIGELMKLDNRPPLPAREALGRVAASVDPSRDDPSDPAPILRPPFPSLHPTDRGPPLSR